MSVQDIIKFVNEECEKAGLYYLIQLDDGKNISGRYSVATNSRLHNMARAVNKLSDSHSEKTL